MTTVDLGADPIRIELHLSKGSDFTCVLHSNNGDWPDTAAITLEVADATWTATLDGPDASFTVDLVDVDDVIAQSPRSVRLFYEDGSLRTLWGLGSVSIRG